MQWELPEPGPDASAHSARLLALIRARIKAAGGWIRFADFMELALYAPGLGYYSAGATKFGPSGDYVTAPEISPLFSQCVAAQCAAVLQALGGGDILEPGAGRGLMAADILRELARRDVLPEHYFILEPGADLRARQVETIATLKPELANRVVWLDSAPPRPLRGVIVANEVADALPVRRFVIEATGISELGVSLRGDELVAACGNADPAFARQVLQRVGDPGRLPQPYVSEFCDRLPAWISSLGDWLETGIVLIFDYGYSRPEYYLPERRSGTLRCYYRHRAHEDPFHWPGLQDITAWVDFSLLADAAGTAGLTVAAYTTQAQFLLAAGLEGFVTQAAVTGTVQQTQLAAGLRTLLLPGEMGETIKTMALARGDVATAAVMQGRDMRSRL